MAQQTLPEAISHFSDKNRQCIDRLVEYFASTEGQQESHALLLTSEPSSRKAAVLVLLFERDGELRVVLTTRGKQLRTHGGQTSLPGGKMEEGDADMVATAFREAHEEVALPIDSQLVHTLGRLELHPFHKLIVTPVIALATDNQVVRELEAAKGEVDHIFSHPLEAMVDPELAPSLEDLVKRGEHWPHGPAHHDFKDYNVASLGNTTYRWHFFRSSATAVTGLTADILIRTAQIAYDKEPRYERYAPDQLRTYEEMVEAYKRNLTLIGSNTTAGWPSRIHNRS